MFDMRDCMRLAPLNEESFATARAFSSARWTTPSTVVVRVDNVVMTGVATGVSEVLYMVVTKVLVVLHWKSAHVEFT